MTIFLSTFLVFLLCAAGRGFAYSKYLEGDSKKANQFQGQQRIRGLLCIFLTNGER
jgi:hypothetical protein